MAKKKKKSKKSVKNNKNNNKHVKNKHVKNNIIIMQTIIIIVLAVILILKLTGVSLIEKSSAAEENQGENQATQTELQPNLLATINGEPVYLEDVSAVYNNIPIEQRTNTSLQESINIVVDNRLLIQDAKKKGFTATETEVDSYISVLLANNGIYIEQLENTLKSQGSSLEQFRENIKTTLLIQKEIDFITKDVAIPTAEEIRAFYDQNPESFAAPGSAQTRQIMLRTNQSNQAEKLEAIKAIAQELNATNFCELVSKHSDDLASIERCGEYNFQQGQLLPEYEQAVFSSEAGISKIIQTSLGFHIIEIKSVTQPRTQTFEEVQESIKNILILRNKQEALNAYLQTLRGQADIVSYIEQ
ncbi:MAG: peptidylprolyl isomerase [Nanoarchaeota archaeon]|nr:peptidylprolyl isomerase [Nanoarchaeota archaeon]MBU1322206.1 peptidylprolyl isomerase [Nanoarchaeota archaeon]MBU1597747.1 peptidylprolyl isomerase [Nanoarchaeota archaeon]MBU2442011.1 peptidylprolyl isomerase [Nanoarchaeota archaeon]